MIVVVSKKKHLFRHGTVGGLFHIKPTGAAETFDTGLAKTVQWLLQNRPWWQKILDGGYKAERIGKLADIF
jgi:hypothetical protein